MSESTPGLVTVFGGSGFVGAQAVRALARQGWRVRVAVRRPALAQDLRILGDVGQIQPVRCDITRPEDVAAALKGAQAAVNLVGILFETPGRGFDTAHVEGGRNVAEACVAAGVGRLVQISAISADVDAEGEYGRSKGQAEAAVRAIKPDAVILRPSIVFGNGDGFLNRFASMATMSPALPLIGGGLTKFQPVWSATWPRPSPARSPARTPPAAPSSSAGPRSGRSGRSWNTSCARPAAVACSRPCLSSPRA